MAFPTPSGLFAQTFLNALNATIVLDLDLLTHKVALFTNAIATTDLTLDVGYGTAPWNANEVGASGSYATGGYTLANTTWTHTAGGIVVWDNTVDPNWTTATITARGALYYADALANNNGICAQTFTSDVTSTAGTFTIALATGGIFSIDFVP